MQPASRLLPPASRSMRFRAFIDGAARGNPGPAGAGVYVSAEGDEPAEEHFEALGHQTNNVAEYSALLLALTRAVDRSASEVSIASDSLLLVQQVLGRYKVKAPHLKPLHAKALELVKHFRRFAITHVPREDNKKADRLANLGADASERELAGKKFQLEP